MSKNLALFPGSNPVHDKPEKRRTGAAKSNFDICELLPIIYMTSHTLLGGFGVGIFENEDEDLDVYGSGMATYDMIIDDDDPPVLLGRISKARDQNRGSMVRSPYTSCVVTPSHEALTMSL